MDPVSGAADTTAVQTELHKVITTFGVEFTEMMVNQMQNVFNNAKQALNEEMND